jgi:hypothetical protein
VVPASVGKGSRAADELDIGCLDLDAARMHQSSIIPGKQAGDPPFRLLGQATFPSRDRADAVCTSAPRIIISAGKRSPVAPAEVGSGELDSDKSTSAIRGPQKAPFSRPPPAPERHCMTSAAVGRRRLGHHGVPAAVTVEDATDRAETHGTPTAVM